MTEPGKLAGSRRTRIEAKPLWDYALDWGVLTCLGGPACRMHWSRTTHAQGRVDSFGYIHWSHLRTRASARSLYRLLTFVAQAQSRPLRFAPEWLKIYESAIWATSVMRRKYKRRVTVGWNIGDRERCERLARRADVPLRAHYVKTYMWVYYGKQHRRDIQRRRDSQGGRGGREILGDTGH